MNEFHTELHLFDNSACLKFKKTMHGFKIRLDVYLYATTNNLRSLGAPTTFTHTTI